jgi:hypothetical protein
VYFHLPYRQTEGIAQGHAKGKISHSIPDYTTISRRINRLDIKIENDNKSNEFEDDYLVIAIDSTGLKITNRGQWMRDKWNVKKERIFENTYVAVNVKNKKILSIKVTDEHFHDDSKAFPGLVENVIKSNSVTAIGKLFADDGAYDSNDIFRYLEDNGYAMY